MGMGWGGGWGREGGGGGGGGPPGGGGVPPPPEDTSKIHHQKQKIILKSLKIIKQAMKDMPEGPINIDNPYLRIPSKQDVYSQMEEMIAHFKVVIDGVKPPVGEVYYATEAANGELGFYIVSDGSGKPWKCRVRPPCFTMTGALPDLCKGSMLEIGRAHV